MIQKLLKILLSTGGTRERPSPPDVIPKTSIKVVDANLIVDYSRLNIPFRLQPKLYPEVDIPNTNSMDRVADQGNNFIYLEPADRLDHQIMVDWIAQQWEDSKGMLAADCVYRIMENPEDDPQDFSKPHVKYVIHRVHEVGYDDEGRYFKFAGTNNLDKWGDLVPDKYKVRDSNILWLSLGVLN